MMNCGLISVLDSSLASMMTPSTFTQTRLFQNQESSLKICNLRERPPKEVPAGEKRVEKYISQSGVAYTDEQGPQ